MPSLLTTSVNHPVARIAPSSLSESAGNLQEGSWQIIERFSDRIRILGKPAMDALGNAVHAYLAVDHTNLPDTTNLSMANDILDHWGMLVSVEPSDIVAAGQRLGDFIKQRYPEHKAYREWPMMIRNEKGQLLQGWIDLMLETPDGYVIIDHKDCPGQNAEERVKKYIPQLKTYKSAIESATGKPVVDTLLHLPISGLVLRLQ